MVAIEGTSIPIIPINDDQFEDVKIRKAVKTETGWEIIRDDGFSFFFEGFPSLEPKEGSTARFYGKGIGRPVRGLIFDNHLVFYRTEKEHEDHMANLTYGENAEEWVRRWDEGKTVWSIEMGGLGPGYEQAIQIAVVEFVRYMLQLVEPITKSDQMWHLALGNPVISKLGLSGAQFGAAYSLAQQLYMKGPKAIMTNPGLKSRHIQISKNLPS